ncbi:MAG TPA: hypothetical protein VGD22_16635 [Sphingobacteriaceae bacterium]
MKQNTNFPEQQNQPHSLAQPIMLGAGIALFVISFFIFGAESNPEWGKLWRIRPLIITPLAGAVGGAFYYFMYQLSFKGRINKTVAVILSLIVYIIGLWMGIVLGLDGTLWD